VSLKAAYGSKSHVAADARFMPDPDNCLAAGLSYDRDQMKVAREG